MLTKMEKLIKGTLDSAVQQMLRDMEERIFTKITTLAKTEIEEALKKERKRWMKDFEKVKDKCNHNEQYSRKSSVRIHGKAEVQGENTERVTIEIFKESLNLEVSPDEIDIVHRTGIRIEGKSRQILVKFKSHKTKVKIFKAKKVNRDKLMKEHKLNITEDLISETYSKLKEIRSLENVEKAWTIDGKINVKLRGVTKPRYNVSSVRELTEDEDEDME